VSGDRPARQSFGRRRFSADFYLAGGGRRFWGCRCRRGGTRLSYTPSRQHSRCEEPQSEAEGAPRPKSTRLSRRRLEGSSRSTRRGEWYERAYQDHGGHQQALAWFRSRQQQPVWSRATPSADGCAAGEPAGAVTAMATRLFAGEEDSTEVSSSTRATDVVDVNLIDSCERSSPGWPLRIVRNWWVSSRPERCRPDQPHELGRRHHDRQGMGPGQVDPTWGNPRLPLSHTLQIPRRLGRALHAPQPDWFPERPYGRSGVAAFARLHPRILLSSWPMFRFPESPRTANAAAPHRGGDWRKDVNGPPLPGHGHCVIWWPTSRSCQYPRWSTASCSAFPGRPRAMDARQLARRSRRRDSAIWSRTVRVRRPATSVNA